MVIKLSLKLLILAGILAGLAACEPVPAGATAGVSAPAPATSAAATPRWKRYSGSRAATR